MKAVRALLVLGVFALWAAPLDARPRHTPPPATAPVTSGSPQLFSGESAVQAHCPREEVVWLNTHSGIYHAKGMRWYGTTRSGAYVCRKEADAAGDRMTRNGQ